MLEKTVVKKILTYLNGLDHCRAVKVQGSSGRSGEPDIDAVLNGRSIKLEVKGPHGKPTVLQLAVLDKWRAAGAIVGVVKNVEEVEELINASKS